MGFRENHPSLYDSDVPPPDRRSAFLDGQVPVTVYGLGKMGLPLATVLAAVSGAVTGADIDPDVVAAVEAGRCPVDGEPGLAPAVESTVTDGSLTATTNTRAAAREAGLHVIVVPTVLDDSDSPDLTALEAVVGDVAAGLARGDLVVVESTVPPGTCRDLVEPALAAGSDLDPEDFGVAFCPERTSSGRALRDIRGAYPKVVGGLDHESTRAARLVYDEVTDDRVIPVADATTAECVKLFEGVYRDVNIALANELATLTDELGIDVREAIEVANTQPFCDIHQPGPGVGGHCIPYYPYFVIDRCRSPVPLLETARAVNERMPEVTVQRALRQLDGMGLSPQDATVVILGVTYRAGVDETRCAPAIPITRRLADRGTDVFAADPICSDMSVVSADPVDISDIPAVDPDLIVLVTAHETFEEVPWTALDDVTIVDCRDAIGDVPHPVYTLGGGSDGATQTSTDPPTGTPPDTPPPGGDR